ncbi:hypothetical protein [Sinomonas atrocyanea]|uniref:hypothetical protein n=1 Tax=Sinomonas atrocyanea TaxID=37927 RepID=UPI002855235C|nr:hypothetical protein [Sinomonas atrocyanea]MDR6623049.1 hypothetical protein [Sinomonas atrocyanea]
MSENEILGTVPNDYRPAKWLTGPKYSKRELQFLAEKLDHSNHVLKQQLFHLRTQLEKAENNDGK